MTLVVFAITILLLVGLHELGHFLIAKKFKVYVDEFAIGFGPRLIARRFGETLYSLRMLPLGGYVKIAGEDTMSAEVDSAIPRERLLTAKPGYVKLLISLAGPAANILVTLVIFISLFWIVGIPYQRISGTIPDTPAHGQLQFGDTIISLNGVPIYNPHDVTAIIAASKGEEIDFLIQRDGEIRLYLIRPRFDPERGHYAVGILIGSPFTNRILSLEEGSFLANAGLQAGDRIIAIEGERIDGIRLALFHIEQILPADTLNLTLLRGEREMEIVLTTTGVAPEEIFTSIIVERLPANYRRFGFFRGISAGVEQLGAFIRLIYISILEIPLGEAVVGPVGIVHMVGEGIRAGPHVFFSFLALLSLSLGLFNLIPFPALDGSRALFALYEIVVRRPFPPRVESLIHTGGFILLLVLILLITYNDIMRFFFR
ncbi:RIP metalloprotease RseP [Candidatus Acetothermia bacterium]|jgi:regulator of sigma E protease|nr:RIP metalloprotease RseP [Candidatus Acetothermia bacterium]MCI2427039.1 RIP metalloprotease RseP [Candidatus Acetothermia bacterium]MCI2428258.1 RIP metalloprotease RseP [Candidatus Acetothermia bacterium]